MAEEHVEETNAEDEQTNGNGNGSSNGHHIGRMAAIAAASGATAYAAKKALDSRSSSGEGAAAGAREAKAKTTKRSKSPKATGASLVGAAVSSGWDVAKDSLQPVIEDAATRAGALVAERSPEVVRDVVIPRFITGFEKTRGVKRDDNAE